MVKTIKYSGSGGPVVASVQVDARRDGSYELRLWEREANGFVEPSPWHGNFINLDDDNYSLPRPNSANDGRLLQCLAIIAVPTGAKPVTVSLVVTQDQKELGRDDKVVAPQATDQNRSLWLALKQGA